MSSNNNKHLVRVTTHISPRGGNKNWKWKLEDGIRKKRQPRRRKETRVVDVAPSVEILTNPAFNNVDDPHTTIASQQSITHSHHHQTDQNHNDSITTTRHNSNSLPFIFVNNSASIRSADLLQPHGVTSSSSQQQHHPHNQTVTRTACMMTNNREPLSSSPLFLPSSHENGNIPHVVVESSTILNTSSSFLISTNLTSNNLWN